MKEKNCLTRARTWSKLGASVSLFIVLAGSTVAWANGETNKAVRKQSNNQGVLVRINDRPLLREEYLRNILAAIAKGQKDTPELRRNVFNEMVMNEVVRQEAQRQKFDKKPEVTKARDEKMVAVFLIQQKQQAVTVDEKEVTERYQEVVKRLGEREWSLRNVVVSTEQARDTVLKALVQKKTFTEVVAQYSEASNKAQGGVIPWLTFPEPVQEGNTAGLPVAVATAVTTLAKGEYTKNAFKVGEQYVVLYLEDVRPMQQPEKETLMATIKEQIKQEKQSQGQQNYVLNLIKKAKIVPVDN